MTKGEIRRQRQVEHAAKLAGDTRNRLQRQADTQAERYKAEAAQRRKLARYQRIAKRERAYADWAMNNDGPGDYEINGPDVQS